MEGVRNRRSGKGVREESEIKGEWKERRVKRGEWEGRGEGIDDAEGVWWQWRRVAA